MILEIKFYGESVLHQKGKPVENFGESLRQFSSDMLETMHEANGIGLAAQQVGQALQFCVVEVTRDLEDEPILCVHDGKSTPQDLLMPLSMANPVATPEGKEKSTMEEGCLSFPGLKGAVERPNTISVEYQDLDGIPHTLECDGLLARCIQHEIDHLNGVLFIDRMKKKDFQEIKDDVRAFKLETRKLYSAE
jgi:peptide deformylase